MSVASSTTVDRGSSAASPTASAHARRVAFACLFASGFAGLVYEIAWIRKASLVFGATGFALSTVLAAFFGGLALGSEVFGRRARRTVTPMRTVGRLELGIALLGAASPWTFALGEAVFGLGYASLYEDFVALTAWRVPLVVALVAPPAFLMGGTLPLFCRQLIGAEARVIAGVSWLYGLNTIGAAAGCLVAGYALVPVVGVDVALWLAATINVGVAVVVLRRPWPELAPLAPAADGDRGAVTATAPPARTGLALLLLFVSGAVALGLEVVWARFLALLVRNTVHTYTLTLGLVLVGLVLGAWLLAPRLERRLGAALAFGLAQLVLGVAVLALLTASPEWWRGRFDVSFAGGRFALMTTVLLLPATMMGATFPLGVRLLVSRGEHSAGGVGRAGAVNTVGGIVGSLAIGFAVIPALGMHRALLGLTAASVISGVAAVLGLARARGLGVRAAIAAGGVALWGAAATLPATRLPESYLAAPGGLLALHEGVGSPLSVVRRGSTKTLYIDRLWQGEDRKNHQIFAAHLPMMLHAEPRRVLVVGLGTGQTAARFLMHDVARLDVVDIEPGLADLVREHFDARWLDDERVRVLVEDGRNLLTHADERWDVISIELGQTFRPGVASFYTRDFYERAAARLQDGGLLCQFVPLAFLDEHELRSIVATFVAVLPESTLWFNTSELLLIGRRGGPARASLARVDAVLGDAEVRTDLEYAHWGGPERWLNRRDVVLGTFLAGPRELAALAEGGEIYRDARPTLEYSTARDGRRPDEPRLVAALREHLGDVGAVFEPAPSPAVVAEAEALREKNLADLLAGRLTRAAYDLQLVGRVQQSLPLLLEAVRHNPLNARAQRLLAYAQSTLGDADAAMRSYAEALQIDPSHAETRRNLALQLMRRGDVRAAAGHLELAVASEDATADWFTEYGVTLAGTGRREEAIAQYRRALELEPTHRTARFNLGVALSLLGDEDGAVEAYRELLAHDPDDVDANQSLGVLLARRGEYAAAIECYRTALQVDPDAASLHVSLGNAYSSLGRTREAIAEFRRAVTLDPVSLEARYNLSILLGLSGETGEALALAQRVVELAPGFAGGHLHRGGLLEQSGRIAEARAAYLEALRLDPASEAAARLEALEGR